MSDRRHVRTERLWLDEPVDTDADALLAIHSDPASWRHFPSGAGHRSGGRGDDNPDPDAVRLVLLDREPDDLFVAEVSAAEGWDAACFIG